MEMGDDSIQKMRVIRSMGGIGFFRQMQKTNKGMEEK